MTQPSLTTITQNIKDLETEIIVAETQLLNLLKTLDTELLSPLINLEIPISSLSVTELFELMKNLENLKPSQESLNELSELIENDQP